jgi:hypothetical protein
MSEKEVIQFELQKAMESQKKLAETLSRAMETKRRVGRLPVKCWLDMTSDQCSHASSADRVSDGR